MQTVYADVFFNVPEDVNGTMSIISGETLVDCPQHLHHFFMFVCHGRVPDDMEGMPFDSAHGLGATRKRLGVHCEDAPLGGWAPGTPLANVLPNRAKGLEGGSLHVNLHYDNPGFVKGSRCNDGLRYYYTTNPEGRSSDIQTWEKEKKVGTLEIIRVDMHPLMIIPPGIFCPNIFLKIPF